jgi:hypothetical protein
MYVLLLFYTTQATPPPTPTPTQQTMATASKTTRQHASNEKQLITAIKRALPPHPVLYSSSAHDKSIRHRVLYYNFDIVHIMELGRGVFIIESIENVVNQI